MAASVAITVRERRVAVLLNRNAQGVRPSVLRRAAALIEARDLFVTGSREEAREAARAMIARGAEVVCVGGGDGTFIQAAGDLLAEAAIAGCDPPMLLPLRLGSGNAIADVAGASANSARGLREDLARASRGGAGRVLRLLRVDEQPAHFAGAGVDAKLNEDFRDLIKQGIGRGRFGRVFHGLPGIVLSLVARTIPRLILDPPLRARVVNTGSHASRLGPDGLPSGAPSPRARSSTRARSPSSRPRGYPVRPRADLLPLRQQGRRGLPATRLQRRRARSAPQPALHLRRHLSKRQRRSTTFRPLPCDRALGERPGPRGRGPVGAPARALPHAGPPHSDPARARLTIHKK